MTKKIAKKEFYDKKVITISVYFPNGAIFFFCSHVFPLTPTGPGGGAKLIFLKGEKSEMRICILT